MPYRFQDIEITTDEILSVSEESLYVYFAVDSNTGYLDANFTKNFKKFEKKKYIHRTMYFVHIEELLFSLNPDKSRREIIFAWLEHIERFFSALHTLPNKLRTKRKKNDSRKRKEFFS